jgi:AraC family transcriptional regulator
MGLQLPMKSHLACYDRPFRDFGAEYDAEGILPERTWRCLAGEDTSPSFYSDILVSRWLDVRRSCRQENVISSSDRHVIAVALKTTPLKLARGSRTVYEGRMPSGTVHVAGPSQVLTAEFRAPCDFIHFHVSNEYLRDCQSAAYPDRSRPIRDLNDFIVCDRLAELLGRALLESGRAGDRRYARSVGHTLVMHIVGLGHKPPTVNALPKWRLRRVQGMSRQI